MKAITRVLDSMTMYRVVLYYLIALNAVGLVLAALGKLQFGFFALFLALVILLTTCWGMSKLFAYTFRAYTGGESSIITALILSLIITPMLTWSSLAFVFIAGLLAIGTKYLLVIHRVHIFNPAAIAVVLTALFAGQAASWWVGGAAMLPFVLVGGVLVVIKLRRWMLVTSFLVVAFLLTCILGIGSGHLGSNLQGLVIQSPFFFFAFVMLTEPMTLPARLKHQGWYAVLVGLLFPPQVHFGGFFLTPEIALVVGNAFAFVTSPRVRIRPVLNQRQNAYGPNMADFVFAVDRPFTYEPGQYMEWTLPHKRVDSRGNRRYFTLASSPTEPNLRLGISLPQGGSSFKRALVALPQHGKRSALSATQLGGDFVMPKDAGIKLVFLAGGIGITPFRSMIKYLLDRHETRDIILLYSEYQRSRIAYANIFEEARGAFGLKVVYFLTEETNRVDDSRYRYGFITDVAIKEEVRDYSSRQFYVAGSSPFLSAMTGHLQQIGVERNRIRKDYFPGC